MQIRNKAVLIYSRPAIDLPKKLNPLQLQRMEAAAKTRYSGMLSDGAKKRLARAVTLLVQSSQRKYILNPVTGRNMWHQLSFITLTVSDHVQKLTGKEAHKKLLAPFLQWLRKTKKVKTYIWKGEHQKNGQIHYHITTPNFIHWTDIRDSWNYIQRRAGLLDSYFEKQGHYNANSTDIHKVNKIKDLAAYLLKYITKSYQNEKPMGGKLWDCSDNLSGKKYFSVAFSPIHEQFIEMAVDSKLATEYKADQFTIVRFKEDVQEYILTEQELQLFKTYMQIIRNPDFEQLQL